MSRAAWIVGGAGTLLALAGWAWQPAVFPHAWLAATVAFSAWPLGSMALLMIHALTGGRWGDALRPALRLGVTMLPLLLPLMVPIVLTLPALYPWARPGAHGHNLAYLNVAFFTGRGVFYLIVWFALGALVMRGARWIAAPGLILLGLTVTFAAIDLTMSLDPEFSSSIYGMLACAGVVLLALSVAVLITAGMYPPPLAGGVRGGGQPAPASSPIAADLGQLLLGLVLLWAYLDFMQLLIVWQSDLVSEVPWYAVRMRSVWGVVMAVIAVGHFLLPFALLLSPRLQRSRRALVGVAGLLIGMELLRTWWTVLPAASRGLSWLDLACTASIGGISMGAALWLQRRPFLARGVQHV